MTTLRPFDAMDLFKFNRVNLDINTETYGFQFYFHYMMNYPDYYQVAEHPNGEIMGYIMGKIEGRDRNWHGHVTAVSIAPDFRRLGLAAYMMNFLELTSEARKAFFVDLFVRVSNKEAIQLYQKLGYVVYRQIIDYYTGERDEDAYDMRKSLTRDPNRRAMVPLGHPVHSRDLEC